MTDCAPISIYLFRCERVAPGGGTMICAAPIELAVSTYGGGGHRDQDGVQRAFGGNTFYHDEATGACFIGVWGRRNVARFRMALRAKAEIVVVREPPPARLAWWNTNTRAGDRIKRVPTGDAR